jgi:peptide-methionine (R)-S-oxide reductase
VGDDRRGGQTVPMADEHASPTEVPSDDELRVRLTPLQYEVTQKGGTEPAFTGEYWDAKAAGTYRCVVCGEELFTSDTKYDSGSGWPSFWQPLDRAKVRLLDDTSHGMTRTEVRCGRCDAHLGHVFPDGPRPTGERYCMNSASLQLDPADGPDG